MAGLIKALFGGRSRPPDPDPLPGVGGYRMPTGRTGEGGFPGSTAATRTMRGRDARVAEIRADTNTGWESGPGTATIERQASYRGDVRGPASPRATSSVRTPQGQLRQILQSNDPSEFYGGPALRIGPGTDTAGGNPSRPRAFHGQRETETPPTQRQPVIGAGTPGSQNVRNQIAQRFRAVPGDVHTYRSAPRADQARVNPSGQASDGNVQADEGIDQVSVPSRFVFPGGGNQTWFMLREMPYGGRGNGARGAQLSGQRYYASGNSDQFWNAGQGDYGISRLRGGRRPVSFTQPGPWSANFYDTTDAVGTPATPGPADQAPDLVYVSPSAGRASNRTGRMG